MRAAGSYWRDCFTFFCRGGRAGLEGSIWTLAAAGEIPQERAAEPLPRARHPTPVQMPKPNIISEAMAGKGWGCTRSFTMQGLLTLAAREKGTHAP